MAGGLAFILWTFLLIRIVAAKANLHAYALISVLMIFYQLSIMALTQYTWTMTKRSYEGTGQFVFGQIDLVNTSLLSLGFLTIGLAFWLFVFSYYSLSYRIHLSINNQPINLYNRELLVLNSLMCTYTVGFPLLSLVFWKSKALFVVFTALGSFSFIVSSFFLLIGLLRLNNATNGLKDFIINKTAISWLLLSTSLLVIANLGMCYFAPR